MQHADVAIEQIVGVAGLAGAAPAYAWGPASMVCDVRFVRLETHARHPNVLFAIGRSDADSTRRGLYRFNPAAIPLVPAPDWVFNATGLFAIDDDGAAAIAAQHGGGLQTGAFDGVRRLDLGTPGASVAVAVGNGDDLLNDLVVHNGAVFMTGVAGGQSVLLRFPVTVSSPESCRNVYCPFGWGLKSNDGTGRRFT